MDRTQHARIGRSEPRGPATLVRRVLLGLGWAAAIGLLGVLPSTNCATGLRTGCGESDEACGTGFICRSDECRRECTSDQACGAGFICVDGGCTPGCTSNQSCGPDDVCLGGQCTPGCTDGDLNACGPGTECRDPGDGRRQCLPIVCTDVSACPIETTCWPPTGPSVCTPVFAVACEGSATAPACASGTCPDGQLCRVIDVQAGEGIEEACGCVPGVTAPGNTGGQ